MLGGFISASGQSAAAQKVYTGIDVVFLVDQSGSMGGAAFGAVAGTRPRDPLNLRFEAVQYAFSTLDAYQQSVPTGTTFRMAVISFGDTSEVTLPWTQISQRTDAEDTAIQEQLSAAAFQKRNLGNTDFLGAFEQAEQLFDALPSEPHLRVIILLSDGAPCAPARFVDRQCRSLSDQIAHMEAVEKLTESAFPPPDYRLYVIAIDDENQFWPQFEASWRTIVRSEANARKVTTATEVGQQFLQILTELVRLVRDSAGSAPNDVIGEKVELSMSGTPTLISVSPYNQAMRITFFKSALNITIQLMMPNGLLLSPENPRVQVTGTGTLIETWTIANPEPGNWSLTSTGGVDLLDVYLDLLRATWKIDLAETRVSIYTPVDLRLSLLDSEGNPLAEYADPRYRLNVTVTAVSPHGESAQLSLTANGLGVYNAQYTPTQPGIYRFQLQATTRNVDGSPLTIITAPDVSSLEATDFTLEAEQQPADRLFMSEIVTVQARLRDSAGTAVRPANIIVEAWLRGGAAGLQARYQFEPGEDEDYTLKLPIQDTGDYQFVVQALAQLPNSETAPSVITEATLTPFSVVAADIIVLSITSPDNNSTQYTTDGFPPLYPTSVTVNVLASDTRTGKPVDLLALEADASGLPLQLWVTRNGSSLPAPSLMTTTEPGVYQAILPDLGEGEFTIRVDATQIRIGDKSIFSSESPRNVVTFTRIANPTIPIFYAVCAISALVVVVVLVFLVRRAWLRRQNPASGQLILVYDSYEDYQQGWREVWRMTLDRERSNQIVVRRGLPNEFKQMVIHSDLGMSQRREVRVEITVSTGQVKRLLLRPQSEQIVTQDMQGAYLILKDPDTSL
jgi:hypothetical protein